MATKVKICGITNKDDALAAADLGADFLGFVFAESPRRIEVNEAAEIIPSIPKRVAKVGLFVNETEIVVKMIADQLNLDYIQLHGDEGPDYCSRLREFRKIIKAFRIKDKASLKILKNYDVDIYLLDSFSQKEIGGTGSTFDWNLAVEAKGVGKQIILAGGLTPANVVEAIKKIRPYAVDVSTGVEEGPGKKDHKLMEAFIKQVKKAQVIKSEKERR